LKNTFAIVTLSALLASCANLHFQSGVPQQTLSSDSANADDNASAPAHIRKTSAKIDNQQAEDDLPSVELTPDLMFQILTADIAAQRGQWQKAYATMFSVAQQTRDPRLARRAAEIALNAKQSGEALAAIKLWRDLAPNSEEAAQYYLAFAILSNDLESARPLLAQRLNEANPQTRGLMMFQIQRMLSRAKDKAAAFSLLNDLMAPYKDTPEAHLALSQGAFANGDMERARAEAHTALTLKPDSELGVLSLAQATPDKDEADNVLTTFLNSHPKAREVRLAYARMLIEQKQYDQARNQFELLLKAHPNDISSLFALGMLSAQANDLKAAEHYLTSYLDALSQNPNDERDPTQALLVLAQIAEEHHDTDSELKWLSQIDSTEPAYLGAQVKRAQILAKRGSLQQARALLAELKPDNEQDQIQLISAEAEILREVNQPKEALSILEKAVKQYPDNTDLLYDYAMMAEKSNDIALMERTLRKVISLSPNNQHAYNALGYSLAEHNIRLPEAYALIEKALQLAPEDPYIMDSMGWVQFRLGKLDEAETMLRRAYQKRQDPEIAVHLGEVLWVKGHKADAQKLWRDANTKDPENDTLKSTLARLHANL
jgi:Flp pilus assembly protein TadD